MTSRLRIIRQASLPLLLAYTILYLLVIYLVMISTLMPRGLFLDPAVNVALNHREELTAGTDPVKFGIRGWDGLTLNMVIRDEQWKVAKIGETFLMGLLAAVLISFLFLAPARTAVMRSARWTWSLQGPGPGSGGRPARRARGGASSTGARSCRPWRPAASDSSRRVPAPRAAAQKRFWNTRRTNTFPRFPNVGPETVRM